jgi:hypothetical protein
MKKLVRSRAGWLASRPAISIRVRPMAMSKCPASSKTVQCGRAGSTGTSFVGSRHSPSDRPAKTRSTATSSASSTEIVSSYEPMPTSSHRVLAGPGHRVPPVRIHRLPDLSTSSSNAMMSRSLTGLGRGVKETTRADGSTSD